MHVFFHAYAGGGSFIRHFKHEVFAQAFFKRAPCAGGTQTRRRPERERRLCGVKGGGTPFKKACEARKGQEKSAAIFPDGFLQAKNIWFLRKKCFGKQSACAECPRRRSLFVFFFNPSPLAASGRKESAEAPSAIPQCIPPQPRRAVPWWSSRSG